MPVSYISARFVGIGSNGLPAASGKLYTYANRTTTPATTYADAAGTTANTNPIILDSAGAAYVYLTAGQLYTFVLEDSLGNLLWPMDDVSGQATATDISSLQSAIQLGIQPWDATKTYAIKSFVERSGSTYESLTINTNVDPATDGGTNWVAWGHTATQLAAAITAQVDASAAGYSITSRGATVGLVGSASGTSASASFTFDELSVVNASGKYVTLTAGSVSVSTTAAAGINSIDTGSTLGSTWYSVWVIYNGTTTSALLSASATAPTMPTGYTHKTRIGWIRTDGTGSRYPLSFIQTGATFQYKPAAGSNVTAFPIMGTGNAGAFSIPTWVAIATAAFCPPTAKIISICGVFGAISSGIIAAPSNAFGAQGSLTNPPPLSAYNGAGGYYASGTVSADFQLESSNIYWASTGCALFCKGWTDSI